MEQFTKIVRRIANSGTAIGSVFLAAIVCLTVASVVVRFFDKVIAGSYELIGLLTVVAITFALVHTAIEHGHVAIDIIVSKFSQAKQSIVDCFTWFLTLGIWALILWSSFDIMLEKGLGEKTELLLVPYLPFRIVMIFGFLLLCLVFFIDLANAIKRTAGQ